MDMGGWVAGVGGVGGVGGVAEMGGWSDDWVVGETHLKDRPTDEMTDSARVESLGESRV